MQEIQKEDTILRNNCCCILGPVSRQPPPANPFSELLIQGFLFRQNFAGHFMEDLSGNSFPQT